MHASFVVLPSILIMHSRNFDHVLIAVDMTFHDFDRSCPQTLLFIAIFACIILVILICILAFCLNSSCNFASEILASSHHH